ncbi:MAG: hypothetical protein QGG26_14395, partial [Candidatus Undinarchaeales archaeon]|nr:hypothetical protein [Candidatus Undinarchaeales archaeon]
NKDDAQQAIECYNRTVGINEKYAIGWSNLAFIYKDKGWYDYAIESFKKVYRIDAESDLGEQALTALRGLGVSAAQLDNE